VGVAKVTIIIYLVIHSRAIRAITRRYNLVSSFVDQQTVLRAVKYSLRGFCLAIPELKDSNITQEMVKGNLLKTYAKLLEAPPANWPSVEVTDDEKYPSGGLVWGPNFSLEETSAIATQNSYTISYSWRCVPVSRPFDDKEAELFIMVTCPSTRIIKEV
jgi:hypothetical protein